jgi:hypothetical protein
MHYRSSCLEKVHGNPSVIRFFGPVCQYFFLKINILAAWLPAYFSTTKKTIKLLIYIDYLPKMKSQRAKI